MNGTTITYLRFVTYANQPEICFLIENSKDKPFIKDTLKDFLTSIRNEFSSSFSFFFLCHTDNNERFIIELRVTYS